MACKFSCFLNFTDAFKENDVGVFHAEDGDVYRVTYKSNVCRDLMMKIEWKIPKQTLVTVKLFNTTYKRCFSSKGMIANGRNTFIKIRGVFNVNNSRNYKVLCVVNVIPYIQFKDCSEIPPESLDDSGFAESEFQESSVDENTIIYEDTKLVEENVEENTDVRNNINIKDNITTSHEHEISRQVENNEQQQLSSGESEMELDETVLTSNMKMGGSFITASKDISSHKLNSGISVSSMNNDSLRTVCKSYESDGNCKSVQTVENEKANLENNYVENNKFTLYSNSDYQTDDSLSSNDTSNNINDGVTSKSQGRVLITKLLTLDDYSEEIVEDISTKSNPKNLECINYVSGSYSSMDIDVTEMSCENQSVPYDKGNILDNSNLKPNKEVSPRNILSEKTELFVLPGDENEDCLQDVVKPVKISEGMETNFIPETNDVSIKSNLCEGKDITLLLNYDIDIYDEGLDSSKTKETNVDSPINKSKPPRTNVEKLSDVIKDAEINNTIKDSHKSELPQLPSSKTGLVFQTLVRKLSVTDCDRELTTLNEVASSSDMNLKHSLKTETDNSKIFPCMESEIKGLSMDMLDLLTTGDMADASITNGEKHIKVHKAIVSARSSVLKELFLSRKQNEAKCLVIVNIPSYILEDVIIFLYVGLVYIKSTEMAQDLYQVAERYNINDLIDICSKYISK